ncbi:hypothetical protein [Micromonospora sp. NPDC048898]|uniref:effector-associated constant component EACC1 n=1 Tax=Micromonospora sp. NPDC048898 TaxID=3364260 RepID=UPI0037141C63
MSSGRIEVDGRDGDLEALLAWLRDEPDLRGRLRLEAAGARPDAMGAASDIIIQLGAATAGAGAVSAAVARSVTVWLTQRRADITITVTGPRGRKVTINAKRVADPEALLKDVLGGGTEQ